MKKIELQISDKVKKIPEALSVYMNNVVYKMKREGYELTVLSLGEAYFDFPFYGFEGLDIKKGYHYSESQGLPELRSKICEYYKKRYNSFVNPNDEILISAGSKPLIYMVLQTILNFGDEVLIHEPAWVSYPEQIKLVGGKPVFIPYDTPSDDFKKYITSKTRVLILNNPNNPAGRTYSRNDLLKIYKDFREKGVYVLMDEAYSDFVNNDSFTSMINIVPDKDGVIVVNSLSKNFGISGWRIGYVIASPEIIYNVLKLNQHLITCPATILCMYLVKHFDELLEFTLPQAEIVTSKRNELEKYVRSVGLDTLGGSSTFYMFINIGDYSYTSMDFAMYLLFRYHIAVVPGIAYGDTTERFIRIGVGTETIEKLKESILTIKTVIKTNEYDASFVQEMMDKLDVKKFTM